MSSRETGLFRRAIKRGLCSWIKERDPWCTARRKCRKGPRPLASLVIRGSIGLVGTRLNPE